MIAVVILLKIQSTKLNGTQMSHDCGMSRKSSLLVIACTLVSQLSIVTKVYNLSTIGAKLSDCIEFEDNLATKQDTTLKSNEKRK